ncbi:Holo-[acyl-carrier-protein] synthase [Meiothermus luteus]|jgi:holo-[acyl-carrier protein] synthase|uniref:Holo-[acyl-carrier-protein] synthase n=1 Tax=Meiothermus luteus TaxID=2026184 RepID=A0A399E9K1_9DEIN|nr:holo-ACP synthase [Meiothermus luteus]RIH81407.1 Holo-[acyl-carrier-protein] synthase [Meiothermus luteus]RMH55511.1 MAG: holo-[acyl-carrier-protein] synthase [Deinococcota bacterium]
MAIVAIGTDLVDLARLKRVWQRHPKRFLERHFVPGEIAYCLGRADPLPSLGARFAAKEAFQKCWPEALGWLEVWVELEGRRPRLGFAPRLAAEMREARLRAHLSLAHERGYALAMVVLEALS